jgi:hypothetical protein
MINLGLIDIVLVLVLLSVFFYSTRKREMLPFYVVLVLVLLIEVERLAPGTMKVIGDGIHSIDAVNANLPHLEIRPIVSIK